MRDSRLVLRVGWSALLTLAAFLNVAGGSLHDVGFSGEGILPVNIPQRLSVTGSATGSLARGANESADEQPIGPSKVYEYPCPSYSLLDTELEDRFIKEQVCKHWPLQAQSCGFTVDH